MRWHSGSLVWRRQKGINYMKTAIALGILAGCLRRVAVVESDPLYHGSERNNNELLAVLRLSRCQIVGTRAGETQ